MIFLSCDGGSRGNPGPAALGVVVKDEHGVVLSCKKKFLGTTTNNVAEYSSLIEGLILARLYGDEVTVLMDSELIIRQARGEYKVKAPHLRVFLDRVHEVARGFKTVVFQEVPREENVMADALVNEELDEEAKRR